MHSGQDNDDPPALPTPPAQLLNMLRALGVDFHIYEHEPIFTVADGEHLKADMPGVHCRNLYLREQEKEERHLPTIHSGLSGIPGIGDSQHQRTARMSAHTLGKSQCIPPP